MTTETAQQEFDRLRTEMHLGRPHYMMSRAEAEKLEPSFFQCRSFDRAKFMAMIDARERMPLGMAGSVAASPRSAPLDTVWADSNAKLVRNRRGRHGRL